MYPLDKCTFVPSVFACRISTVTCSLLGGADQGSEWRTRGFEYWTRCMVKGVQLPVAKRGMKTTKTWDDSDELRDDSDEGTRDSREAIVAAQKIQSFQSVNITTF